MPLSAVSTACHCFSAQSEARSRSCEIIVAVAASARGGTAWRSLQPRQRQREARPPSAVGNARSHPPPAGAAHHTLPSIGQARSRVVADIVRAGCGARTSPSQARRSRARERVAPAVAREADVRVRGHEAASALAAAARRRSRTGKSTAAPPSNKRVALGCCQCSTATCARLAALASLFRASAQPAAPAGRQGGRRRAGGCARRASAVADAVCAQPGRAAAQRWCACAAVPVNPNPRLADRLAVDGRALALPHAELKKCLRAVFCQFGTILDVVLCKAYKLRGQAWVVFSTVEEATEAKAMMEGFPLYEKPLVRVRVRCGKPPLQQLTECTHALQRLQFARSKSDVVAKADGTFQPRPAYDKAKRMAEVKGAAVALWKTWQAVCSQPLHAQSRPTRSGEPKRLPPPPRRPPSPPLRRLASRPPSRPRPPRSRCQLAGRTACRTARRCRTRFCSCRCGGRRGRCSTPQR